MTTKSSNNSRHKPTNDKSNTSPSSSSYLFLSILRLVAAYNNASVTCYKEGHANAAFVLCKGALELYLWHEKQAVDPSFTTSRQAQFYLQQANDCYQSFVACQELQNMPEAHQDETTGMGTTRSPLPQAGGYPLRRHYHHHHHLVLCQELQTICLLDETLTLNSEEQDSRLVKYHVSVILVWNLALLTHLRCTGTSPAVLSLYTYALSLFPSEPRFWPWLAGHHRHPDILLIPTMIQNNLSVWYWENGHNSRAQGILRAAALQQQRYATAMPPLNDNDHKRVLLVAQTLKANLSFTRRHFRQSSPAA